MSLQHSLYLSSGRWGQALWLGEVKIAIFFVSTCGGMVYRLFLEDVFVKGDVLFLLIKLKFSILVFISICL